MILRGEQSGNLGNVLPNLNAYSILAFQFTDATNSLAIKLGLEDLNDSTEWADFFNGPTPTLSQLYTNVRIARLTIPKLISLLEQKDSNDYLASFPNAQKSAESVSKLSLILLEDGKTVFQT